MHTFTMTALWYLLTVAYLAAVAKCKQKSKAYNTRLLIIPSLHKLVFYFILSMQTASYIIANVFFWFSVGLPL